MLRSLNRQLHPYVADAEAAVAAELARVEEELSANEVLQRRDYPFCLFPEAKLRDFYQAVVQQVETGGR
jgi:hypothetical protein